MMGPRVPLGDAVSGGRPRAFQSCKRATIWMTGRSAASWAAAWVVIGSLWNVSLAYSLVRSDGVGVHPRQLEQYSGPRFSCQDGSKIDASQINDDFCDCADGSDEPATAACSTAGGQFWCINKGHHGRFLFSSFVNDGVCDCCDGSDEDGSLVQCSNRCEDVGREIRRQLQRQIEMHEAGHLRRAEYAQRGAKFRQGVIKRQEELESQIAPLTAKREEMQKQALERSRELAFSTAEFNAQFIQDETERELAQLKVKYDRELELAENNEALKTELIRRYGVERARAEQKASEKLAASVVGYLDFIGKGFAEAGVGALMFGDNFKESIKQVLEGLAREAAVKSLMQFAEAAAYSFVNPALAAQHATAGGLFAAVASAAKVSHMAMGGGGGGGGGSSASPSGAPLSAPAPQREQASTEAMTFNINFGGAVIYDTRRAAEQALADRVVETINRPRRGAVRMNSRG